MLYLSILSEHGGADDEATKDVTKTRYCTLMLELFGFVFCIPPKAVFTDFNLKTFLCSVFFLK